MEAIRQLLEDNLHSLNRAQQKIALFILENAARVRELELNELAEAAGVSRSSVLRFLQMLGFSGYREFRRQLAAVPQTATKNTAVAWLMQATEYVTRQTIAGIDHRAMEEAIDRCASAPRLFWYGVGESGLLAEVANYRCWLIGIDSNFCREMGHFTDFSHRIRPEEVLIVISRTGNGDYLYEPLQSITERGIFTIGITSNRLSWLAENASLCLYSLSRYAQIETRYVPVRAGCEFIYNALILGTALKRGIPFRYGEDALPRGGGR
jgi:DNA-binding MurR/RpiR family transcriptional regulator